MKAISPVLPNSPQLPEVVLAKDQPQYLPLPVCTVQYTDGEISMISRYRLSFFERIKLLFTGSIWLEQMTFGRLLQPQRPTINEPLTDSDTADPKPSILRVLRDLCVRPKMSTANEAAAISAEGFVSIDVSTSNAISTRDVPADGWFPFATLGEHPSPDRTYIQVLDRAQAEEMVKTWNSVAGKFGRFNKNLRHRLSMKFSAPIFENHIDTDPSDWSQLKPLGEATEMRVTANAIEVFVKWNSANMANRGPGPLYPSALWWHEPPNDQRKVFPVLLESIALVQTPNITSVPAWTQNASPEATENQTTQNQMDRKEIIRRLGLGADATDDQILSAIEDRTRTANAAIDRKKLIGILGLGENATNDEIVTAISGVRTTANAAPDRAKLITELKLDANATNDQIVAALSNLNTDKATLTTANSILVDGILDAFELAGKITPAQRVDVKAKFTANIANSAAVITELKTKKEEVNTKHLELNGQRLDISTANARANAVQSLVSKRMKDDDCDYNTAYDRVAADPNNKQLFELMADPTKAKAA